MPPLVTVLLAVHDDAGFLTEAIDSVLGQSLRDLELIVIDDASNEQTCATLAAITDPRVTTLRNAEQQGLATSLNLGFDHAKGKYVARLDADDVAVADRLARQVERLSSNKHLAAVGSAVIDLDAEGRLGRTHVMPGGPRLLRWHALFSSPFFHPTVLVDREQLDAHKLRYDPSFLESEDYDLWARLLAFADGDNLPEPLVLKRVHPGQASQRRRDLQESFQRRVALGEIERLAEGVDADRAWRVGARRHAKFGARREFLRLLVAFERRYGRDADVRRAAMQAMLSPRPRT